MSYCSNCGQKLPEDALFCPKCGTKTAPVTATNVPIASDEMRQAFTKMSAELENAFAIAAREIEAAFQTARENIQKSMKKEPVVCSNCGQSNPGGSVYCFKCGHKLKTEVEKKKA